MPFPRCWASALRLALCFFSVLALVALSLPVWAQNDSAFIARGIEVDVTAASAAEAREQALAEGRALAYRQLLANLTVPEDHGRLPPYDGATVGNMILGFEIEEEKASNVRYLATLTYEFDPDSVRGLLGTAGIPFAETRSRPLVVVPVLRDGGTSRLWDDGNPWRQAWTDQAGRAALVPLTVPIGDLVDIGKVTAEKALAGDSEALMQLATRYQAVAALVAVADVGGANFTVSAFQVGSEGRTPLIDSTIAGEGNARFKAAAALIAARVEDNWKRQNLLRTDERATLKVLVPVQTLSEWVLIKNRLNTIGAIRSAKIVHLQRGQAQVELDYFGSLDQLRRAMVQRELNLTEGLAAWVLALSGSPQMPIMPDVQAGSAQPEAPSEPSMPSGPDEPIDAPGTGAPQ